VQKRMLVDSKEMIGCLLSGGLDSSIISALVAENFLNKKDLHTFSIGLKDSVDLKYAKVVAEYLGTTHHEIIVSEKEMLESIPEVIKQIESFDITTIRASTPMYLLSKYIKNNTNIKVVFSGEGSDEASGSYIYFHNAPNPLEFQNECLRLLQDLHYFDLLRADKTTSGNGLELRVPFMDINFLKFYMSIDPKLKMPKNFGIEKYILRKSFENILPKNIIYRTKEAFSDGISSQTNSWFNIIQKYINEKISDLEFSSTIESMKSLNLPIIPETKESLYYYLTYKSFYKDFINYNFIIPYYWLPKWSGDIKEPSARVLETYKI
jgi:asparagine synthase (glutamine-hydrolysing)